MCTFCFKPPAMFGASVLGIFWAWKIGFCLFSSFHVQVNFPLSEHSSCIYTLWQGVPQVCHILRGSLTLLFILNLTLTFAFWWYSVLRLGEIKWSIHIHYLLATQDPVCLFYIPPTKWVLPFLIHSVIVYFSLLITFGIFLWTFSHFNVFFLLWGNQNCTESSRIGTIISSYEIRIFPSLFSNLFLIMSKFWWVFWVFLFVCFFLTSIEQRDDIFLELSIMYHFKFIFFVLFHLPFYCLDMLSCKSLLPSLIVCPHPYHLEGFRIFSNLCCWIAHTLLKLIYAYIKQQRLVQNTPGDFWLLQELTTCI